MAFLNAMPSFPLLKRKAGTDPAEGSAAKGAKFSSEVELHGYQIDFLNSMAKAFNLDGPGAALQVIVDRASSDDNVEKEIFDTFHCVHCMSQNPGDWIKNRKGAKDPYGLTLTAPAVEYLEKELLVKVEKLGEPPVRQVVPGPRSADYHKAARTCIDWGIKHYGAVADGAPPTPEVELHGYQIDFLNSMAKSMSLVSPGAALQVIVDQARLDESVQKDIFDTFQCVHCNSTNPADWIKNRKGTKEPYALPLAPSAVEYLRKDLLAKVEKLGDPLVRQVVPGPRHADYHKAARTCIDWGIKHYDALADGNVAKEWEC